jgi:hypothetical protein
MRNALNISSAPPHLREACNVLAAGLLRLRRDMSQSLEGDKARIRDPGEVSLHFPAGVSSHAAPQDRECT